MIYLFNASGANTPLVKDFPIESYKSIADGTAVGLKDGLIVPADEQDVFVGVAAEDHPGLPDMLNARADGEKIRVSFSPTAVYGMPAQKITVTAAGTATTVKCASANLSASLANGRLVLLAKAEGSTNPACVGSVRKFTTVTISGNEATFTVENGGKASVGDVYAVLPAIGSEVYLSDLLDGAVVYNGSTTVTGTLVCVDEKNAVWGVMFADSFLA